MVTAWFLTIGFDCQGKRPKMIHYFMDKMGLEGVDKKISIFLKFIHKKLAQFL